MLTNCPHCKKRFDVPIKTVLDWIRRNTRLLAAVKSLIAGMIREKANPENMARNVDYAELARKSHEARRAKKTE
jgi:hypothetical protein